MVQTNEIIRIGIVYDGSYFARISDHYAYEHERKARIHIQGLHEFIRQEVAACEQAELNTCRITEAHYFRGRFPADEAERRDSLTGDRRFEDVLIRAGVTPHFLLLALGEDGAPPREKGVDVWLALEAYELASVKRCNVIVLISGDGDHVQLVRKLNSLGARVMVLGWDIGPTRTAQALINAATYPIEMAPRIDRRTPDPLVDGMFMPSSAQSEGRWTGRPSPVPVPNDPAPAVRPETERVGRTEHGTVTNLPMGRDYGFIQPDDGGENIHFHFSAVLTGLGPRDIGVGSRVGYVPTVNPSSGKLTARQVRTLGQGG